MRTFFLNLIVISFFIGCSSVKQNIADNITYEIINLEVDIAHNFQNALGNLLGGNLDKALEGDIKVYLAIKNKNSMELITKKIQYNVFMNNIYIGRGLISDDIIIPSNGKKTLKLPLHVNSKVLLSKGINLFNKRSVNVIVKGTCTYSGVFGEEHIPFEIQNGKITLK